MHCYKNFHPIFLKAVSSRKLDIVEYLLLNGANVNASDKKGETPLICSASGLEDPNTAITQHLLDKGADISKRDKTGKTALFSGNCFY